MMAAATAQRQHLLHVVPEQQPDFLRKRHFNMKIGQKHTHAGVPMRVVVSVAVMHNYSHAESLRSFRADPKEPGSGIGDEACRSQLQLKSLSPRWTHAGIASHGPPLR
jgi:hypothetical protein